MAAYLLFTNVLLINLLIAIFRYSCNHGTKPHFKTLSLVTKQPQDVISFENVSQGSINPKANAGANERSEKDIEA